ncbi:Rhodanese-like domain-containing protein [Mucor mucedo]|uniref:Rhodanese-like domain-containing protein n=1 Tax=Mucor mucedo TaxID=29922 RepID=UPI00222090CF|nr:Rhodanese-like domain-containing protein [Mucor mucedo]KAI7893839.1 Rhodanese-like domain-containing protein [Mucor mucedo]
MLKHIIQNVISISRNGKKTPQPSIYYNFPRRFLFTSQKFKPIAFYSIVALTETRVATLRNVLEKELSALGVVGRIYIAPEQGIGGINCQMAVPIEKLDTVKSYFDGFKNDFGQIEYNEGIEDTSSPNFSKLRVLVKNNLVSIRQHVTTQDLAVQPHHLTPEDWHSQLSQKNEDLFLLDMRNQYEYHFGHFKHAIKMDVDTFRDGIQLLDELVANRPKGDDIYMYCTGGIRCSVAGTYLKKKGYENVKMLKGGITAYGHYIKENQEKPSLFKGKNFTFDGRRGEPITNDVLTQCYHCGSSCDHVTNCVNNKCHLLFVQCETCKSKMKHTCSDHCHNVLKGIEEYKLDYDYHRQVAKAW